MQEPARKDSFPGGRVHPTKRNLIPVADSGEESAALWAEGRVIARRALNLCLRTLSDARVNRIPSA